MKKLFLLIILPLLINSCADNREWFKSKATNDEFQKVRYACLRNSQQSTSNVFVNSAAGHARYGMETNDNLFTSCMYAEGWIIRNKKSK